MKKQQDRKPKQPEKTADDATGTYVYDPTLKKVVKVSSDIPSVASKASGPAGAGSFPSGDNPCGGACGTGSCPMGGGF
jgi:hypothetical protein